jgi:hypothetical protein
MEPDAVVNLCRGTGKVLTDYQYERFLELLGKLIWLCVTRSDIAIIIEEVLRSDETREGHQFDRGSRYPVQLYDDTQ